MTGSRGPAGTDCGESSGTRPGPGGPANPFVGPRPFEPGERLWGRDEDVDELEYLLNAERVVLLHSPSGAGKSSLVQAGLLPRIRPTFDIWGPTRCNQELPGPETLNRRQINRYVLSAVQGFEEAVPERLRRRLPVLAAQTMTEYVEQRPRRRSAPPNTLLVFDQFEEILTVDPLAVAAKQEFFSQLGELLHNRRVWALFVLREDFLAPLDPYAQLVPTHLKNRYRIDLLGLDGARQAMVEPARAGGREFPAAVQLVHDLATMQVQQADGSFVEETGQHVEPVQLQVVCRRLWSALPEDSLAIDTANLQQFGDVTGALAGYYADSVARIAGEEPAGERLIRDWFEERLITPAGIRGQVLRGAGASEGLANEVIRQLLDTHLVRAEQRAGATWYELAHDRLIAPVRSDNGEWFEQHLAPVQQRAALWERQDRPVGLLCTDQELAAAEDWAATAAVVTEAERGYLESSSRARDVRRRERRQARLIQALAVVATIVGVIALFQWRLAERRRAAAENLTRAAVSATLFDEGRTPESNLLLLEVRRPEETPSALAALHRALTNPVEQAILAGHTADVYSASLSPDGDRVLTASVDRTARVWSLETGVTEAILSGHTDEIWAAAWSPDGRRVATVSHDTTARIFDLAADAESVVLEGHTDAVLAVAWSPDGSRLATISLDATARIWTTDGRPGPVLRPPDGAGHDFVTVAWSPDGERVATNLGAGTARIWDAATGDVTAVLSGHTEQVSGLAWSPDGQRLATASDDATARIWEPVTGANLGVLSGHTAEVSAVAWSPDGARLLTASIDSTGRIWDSTSGAPLATLVGHTASIWSAGWGPDGSWVVTSSDDQTARVWMAADGQPVTVLAGHTGQILTISLSADGADLVTASSDSTARVWRPWQIGEEITALRGHGTGVVSVAWSPDGKRVLTASRDQLARVWSPDGREMSRLVGHTDGLRKATWSPDGTRVATASFDHTARIWDPVGGAALVVLTGHTEVVADLAWSPDSSRVATASSDATARIWDAADGEQLLTLEHSSAAQTVRWSPDGSQVLTASADQTAMVSDAATGATLALLAGHEDSVNAALWSPGGTTVLTVSSDRTARIWDAVTGTTITQLTGHTAEVVMAAWSPDGTQVLTGSWDWTARVFNVASGELLTILEQPDDLVSVAWSPDGTRIATTTWAGRVLIWQAASGEPAGSLAGHTTSVWMAAWSADGSRLLTASDDGTARIWAVSDHYSDYLRGRIRGRLRRCLDPGFYTTNLGPGEGEAQRRHDACTACVPRFFEQLGSSEPQQGQIYEQAWVVYEDCFSERLGG